MSELMTETVQIPLWVLSALVFIAVLFGGVLGFASAAYAFAKSRQTEDR